MSNSASTLLFDWLETRLDAARMGWLQSRLELHRGDASSRDLHVSLGLAPRKLGRADLALTPDERDAARRLGNDRWHPDDWTVETAARLLILLAEAERDPAGFGDTFVDLCRTADLGEAITYYRAIVLLPESEAIARQVGDGLRTNMRAVFEAIAHRNAYPRENFDLDRWNHMVLKALFVESPLWPIIGLDERANAELATVLSDYAHERWAAGRPVSPELWRCVGPFARGILLDDLKRVIDSPSSIERRAGLLALADSPDPQAEALLKRFADEAAAIEAGRLTWDSLMQDSLMQDTRYTNPPHSTPAPGESP